MRFACGDTNVKTSKLQFYLESQTIPKHEKETVRGKSQSRNTNQSIGEALTGLNWLGENEVAIQYIFIIQIHNTYSLLYSRHAANAE